MNAARPRRLDGPTCRWRCTGARGGFAAGRHRPVRRSAERQLCDGVGRGNDNGGGCGCGRKDAAAAAVACAFVLCICTCARARVGRPSTRRPGHDGD